MNINSLREAREFARNYGCKALVFGPPGSGKTPVVNTARRPCLLAVEPGMLSMRGSTVPTFQATKWTQIKEFFDWWFGSKEVDAFDTLGIDSVSQICEIHLRDNPRKVSHGLQQYGTMAEDCGDYFTKLYYQERKHMYLICKQEIEQTQAGFGKKRPYFPGKDLNVKMPHLFDLITQLDTHVIPGYGSAKAFHTHSAMDAFCRDRSGTLDEYEPPNLAAIFDKTMNVNA